MLLYATLAEDFYCNMNLNTEMALPAGRETILGFLERVQKTYPSMRNFFTRENGDFVLEEDKEGGQQRWISIEPRRICSGFLNPPTIEEAMEQHELVLDLIPYMLSVSKLDCEALDYMLGFDYQYRGNHDQLVAEVLGVSPSFASLAAIPGAQMLSHEPTLTIALEDSCRRQARILVETRTNAYQVRRQEFAEENITVYFTVRQYGSLGHDASFQHTLRSLREMCDELMEQCVVDQILRPLHRAIESRQ
jgi:hypothetical protein